MGHMEENESLTPLTILQVPSNKASPSFHDSSVTGFCVPFQKLAAILETTVSLYNFPITRVF